MRDLHTWLAARREGHLLRTRRIAETAQGVRMRIDGRDVIPFCSNDYLGLANHPKVIEALARAASHCGIGSGAAHLINGHHRLHHELEERLAAFTGRERALLFSTGYMANLGVLQALAGPGDLILADRLNHASLLDGARLSRARLQRYPHRDTAALARWLDTADDRERLIVTDGVFSMDGDIAPLPELARLAAGHGAWLVVDDAHGLGVLGEHGRGSIEHLGLDPSSVTVLIGTLGKAFGTAGAFVAGSADLIEYLVQSARAYIYTTASPPAIAAATLASLELVEREPERREQLRRLIQRFRARAAEIAACLLPSETPIQGVLTGDSETALRISDALFEAGFLVTAIRPPTVPEGAARLRITLSATHAADDVDEFATTLVRFCQKFMTDLPDRPTSV